MHCVAEVDFLLTVTSLYLDREARSKNTGVHFYPTWSRCLLLLLELPERASFRDCADLQIPRQRPDKGSNEFLNIPLI